MDELIVRFKESKVSDVEEFNKTRKFSSLFGSNTDSLVGVSSKKACNAL